MAKKSGQVEITPPEGIERQIEGLMFNVLVAMEKRITECIEKFEPPAAPSAPALPEKQVKTDEEKKIDEINRKRLEKYGKQKKAERQRAAEIDKKAFAQFQAWQKEVDNG